MEYILKLYITGKTPRSDLAIRNLNEILTHQNLANRYELRIIDLMENPHIAEQEKILATPTLVKELPPPVRRLVGDLSAHDKVYVALDVLP